MKLESFELPRHWACALINGDADGFDPNEERTFNRFTDWMLDTYGKCWCVNVDDDESGNFSRTHDAIQFGGLPCEVASFTFDVDL
jgi:hypothetical protein